MRSAPRGRSGITLTEILISILIMGVGLISLATLFPIGLLRLRAAARATRSAYLAQAAEADVSMRNLFNKSSFSNLSWYNLNFASQSYDPWTQDTLSYDSTTTPSWIVGVSPTARGVSRGIGPGLPVAYDPLWRFQTGVYPGALSEARFASGIGFVRDDPSGGPPSAHGLQRITNFNPLLPFAAAVPSIFVSPEDVVFQSDTEAQGANNAQGAGGGGGATKASPLIPEISTGAAPNGQTASSINDWKFSWMFTGQQSDASNGTVFDGDLVVFENRPFALDTAVSPLPSGGSILAVAGEIVVEAVFGPSASVNGTPTGFGVGSRRSVLLRWPVTMPDPEVKLGSWIADVTYERSLANETARFTGTGVPGQRCYWYQVVKKTDPIPDPGFTGDPAVAYRRMTVTVNAPLKSQTLLSASNGHPFHVNAALISPYVVNVFPRSFYTR